MSKNVKTCQNSIDMSYPIWDVSMSHLHCGKQVHGSSCLAEGHQTKWTNGLTRHVFTSSGWLLCNTDRTTSSQPTRTTKHQVQTSINMRGKGWSCGHCEQALWSSRTAEMTQTFDYTFRTFHSFQNVHSPSFSTCSLFETPFEASSGMNVLRIEQFPHIDTGRVADCSHFYFKYLSVKSTVYRFTVTFQECWISICGMVWNCGKSCSSKVRMFIFVEGNLQILTSFSRLSPSHRPTATDQQQTHASSTMHCSIFPSFRGRIVPYSIKNQPATIFCMCCHGLELCVWHTFTNF